MITSLKNGAWEEASRGRILLSWTIDYLFFMCLWKPFEYFLGEAALPYWLPYVLFVILRIPIARYVGSIGNLCLSISGRNNAVDEHILNRERWYTLLLGILFVFDGSKMIVAWTDVFISQPWFGIIPDEAIQIGLEIGFGVTSLLTGCWILKLDVKGWISGILISLLYSVSFILSWNLWDSVAAEMLVARRGFKEVPVTEIEMELVQSLIPEGMLLVSILTAIVLLVSRGRFSRSL